MPRQFTKKAVRNLYLKFKATDNLKKIKNPEFLLYVLKSVNLNDEVIDFCSAIDA